MQRFPALGDKQLISSGGGRRPRWSRDGQELFYANGSQLMVVPVLETEPTFRVGTPETVFEGPQFMDGFGLRFEDISLDGEQFLMLKSGVLTGDTSLAARSETDPRPKLARRAEAIGPSRLTMPIQPGTTLGPYAVTAKIGEGGMGEVYRARDTKLDRDVALKVLPEAFTQDPDRLARFEREAKVLASLNHPNIAAIYGLEEAGDTRALVLELVEGPTLADRIKRGPIPLDEAPTHR